MVVVVKTEDEACGGPLKFYPLLPGEPITSLHFSQQCNGLIQCTGSELCNQSAPLKETFWPEVVFNVLLVRLQSVGQYCIC